MSVVAIVGKSGEGKSTAAGKVDELEITGLDPKSTFYINVAAKDLPFRSWSKLYNTSNKNYLESSDSKVITEVINQVSQKHTIISKTKIRKPNQIIHHLFSYFTGGAGEVL